MAFGRKAKNEEMKKSGTPDTPPSPKSTTQHVYECWNCGASTVTDVGPLRRCPACEAEAKGK